MEEATEKNMEVTTEKKKGSIGSYLKLAAILLAVILLLLLVYFPKKQHIAVNGTLGAACESLQADITIWHSILLTDSVHGKELTVIWDDSPEAVTYDVKDSLYIRMKDKTQLVTLTFYDPESNVCGHVSYCWNEKTGFSELESYRIGGEKAE